MNFTEDEVTVILSDGSKISNPLDWHWWLNEATPAQRANHIMGSDSILWPDLDEGLDVEGNAARDQATTSPPCCGIDFDPHSNETVELVKLLSSPRPGRGRPMSLRQPHTGLLSFLKAKP